MEKVYVEEIRPSFGARQKYKIEGEDKYPIEERNTIGFTQSPEILDISEEQINSPKEEEEEESVDLEVEPIHSVGKGKINEKESV